MSTSFLALLKEIHCLLLKLKIKLFTNKAANLKKKQDNLNVRNSASQRFRLIIFIKKDQVSF